MPLAHAKLRQEKLYAKESIKKKAWFIQKATKGRNARSDTQDNAPKKNKNIALIQDIRFQNKNRCLKTYGFKCEVHFRPTGGYMWNRLELNFQT